jgi:hypothetical protein
MLIVERLRRRTLGAHVDRRREARQRTGRKLGFGSRIRLVRLLLLGLSPEQPLQPFAH